MVDPALFGHNEDTSNVPMQVPVDKDMLVTTVLENRFFARVIRVRLLKHSKV